MPLCVRLPLCSPSALSLAKVELTPGVPEALRGRQMIDVFNTVGVDVVTFGNHEFDISEANLRSRMTEAKFPFIGTNVSPKDGFARLPNMLNYTFFERGGVKIAMIG